MSNPNQRKNTSAFYDQARIDKLLAEHDPFNALS